MEPQVIAAIISGSIGAFAGISRALGNFNKKIDRKFDRIQREVDDLKNTVIQKRIRSHSRPKTLVFKSGGKVQNTVIA